MTQDKYQQNSTDDKEGDDDLKAITSSFRLQQGMKGVMMSNKTALRYTVVISLKWTSVLGAEFLPRYSFHRKNVYVFK